MPMIVLHLSLSIDNVIGKLQENYKLLIIWYKSKYLKSNPVEWHLLSVGMNILLTSEVNVFSTAKRKRF